MFWSRRLVDDETADWVEVGFAWLIDTFQPKVFFDETDLILPTRAFFSSPGGDSHETAQAVFDDVRRHMGMTEWHCRLERQEMVHGSQVSDFHQIEPLDPGPSGTFDLDGNEVVISYDPGLMARPVAFIDMLSHELAHYLLANHVDTAPGGAEAHEVMTDLAAIYAGFGVLQLQGGSQISGFQDTFAQCWQISHLGYLSSEVRAYALVVFLRSKGIAPEEAIAHLSDNKARLLRLGLKQADIRRDQIGVLAAKRGG
ncbi:MAG: hypothetical protein AAFV19_22285 [Pseudomonadota bacterium]